MLDKVKNAKIGSIVPIFEVIEGIDAEDLFIKLSDYGRNKNSIFLESAEIMPKHGELSIGSSNPCLKVIGKGSEFEIKALNNLGTKFLLFLKGNFKFCDKVEHGRNVIKGKIKKVKGLVDEDKRLALKSHLDVLRTLTFKFKPDEKPLIPYAGLFGAITSDFVDQFENLNCEEGSNEINYEMFFLDNLFIKNHIENKTYIISNALVMDDKREKLYNECLKTIESYKKALKKKIPKNRKYKIKEFQQTSDTTKEEFIASVNKLKKQIYEGNILQIKLSREITSNYNAEPYEIYKKLKQQDPSPYMFFINNDSGILIGSSLGINLKVHGDNEKNVSIKILGSQTKRGFESVNLNKDLDNKFEADLKINKDEISQQMLLIDSARNDITRISESGSRFVDELYSIEKLSDKQYVSSSVKGRLRGDLDAFHAYLVTMNRHAGFPKIAAMKLLKQLEKTKRNYHSGAVCFFTPSNDLRSVSIKKSIRLKNNKAYIRGESNIVASSDSKETYQNTKKMIDECLKAIKLSGGLK